VWVQDLCKRSTPRPLGGHPLRGRLAAQDAKESPRRAGRGAGPAVYRSISAISTSWSRSARILSRTRPQSAEAIAAPRPSLDCGAAATAKVLPPPNGHGRFDVLKRPRDRIAFAENPRIVDFKYVATSS